MFGFNDNYIWDKIVKEENMLFYLGNSIVVDVLIALLKQMDITKIAKE